MLKKCNCTPFVIPAKQTLEKLSKSIWGENNRCMTKTVLKYGLLEIWKPESPFLEKFICSHTLIPVILG